MKPLEKISLISDVACELQRRMTYEEIDSYLVQYKIDTNIQVSVNSKRVYAQTILKGVDEKIIIDIAEELGLKVPKSDANIVVKDPEFWKLGYFRIFISHLTENKSSATNLKQCLEDYAISGFVAHEDIEPTKEWQTEIEVALFSMDCLCAIVTPKFIESKWCDQEVGVAIGRGKTVIPIRKGADPYGLFGKYQGVQSNKKDANTIAKEVFKALCNNENTNIKYLSILKSVFLNSKNLTEAEKWIEIILNIPTISLEFATDIHSKFLDNSNLNNKSILAKANMIFGKFSLTPYSPSHFNVYKEEVDDLPF